jgi:regulator of sirC expression with transglutaminase-like and TPR domain
VETGIRRRFTEAARCESVDLGLLCLLVGAEADRSLDETGLARAGAELDRLAALVEPASSPVQWAASLAEVLGVGAGFRGGPSDYRRLESSLLPAVLRRRRGLPILLSVVWMEVGRRAGAPVYGVALPGHFVVGVGDPCGGHVLVDPFRGGRLLDTEDAALLVAGATGGPMAPGMLLPAEPLDIVLRVLNNIRAWAAARPEHSAVQLWAVELCLLLPHHPARLRLERAQLLVQRGDFLTGAAEMDSYADLVATVDPPAAESIHNQALAARAHLN